ncbi:FimB/Mfa2 family fimbrial subunit [Alistipes onderdonkii]|uniref:FimB/Mfa2 family fimbrial subunit n=1 Tax=Alistipes onderdonkii TaxID=328813 RepID=UPI0036F1D4F7
MKQLKTFVLSMPFVLSAVGCSQDELLPDGGKGTNVPEGLHEVEITFEMGTSGGLQTRTANNDCLFIPDGELIPKFEPPRKLISSNNWQQVNDVRIYVFKQNEQGKFVYYCSEDKSGTPQEYFSAGAFTKKFESSPYAVWWGGNTGKNEMHGYSISPLLTKGTYRFLVIARDDKKATPSMLTNPNEDNAALSWKKWEAGTTTLEEATLACTNRDMIASAELFTGCTSEPGITVTAASTSFQQSIELKRAVAGVLLYVENIPAKIEQTGEASTGVILLSGRTIAVGLIHGQVTSGQVKLHDRSALPGRLTTVENSTIKYPLLRIDIPEGAKAENGYYVNLSPKNIKHPHSLLGGVFTMPQAANAQGGNDKDLNSLQKSLYIVLYGECEFPNGIKSEFARIIPVRFKSNKSETDAVDSTDPYYFPIHANHFYSLGKRKFKNDGTGLEEDEPIDLKKVFEGNAEITLQIDPFWNEYYGGNIGEQSPGIGLDPEWGDHPAGNLENK